MTADLPVLWWLAPCAGDIVWCMFPHLPALKPARKPRPVLVIEVFDDTAPEFVVTVAYGTSQRTDRLFAGEFGIRKQTDPVAYRLAGLSYDTKFSFTQVFQLPFNDAWFKVPPDPPFGRTPQLGLLHPSLTARVSAAWAAAKK